MKPINPLKHEVHLNTCIIQKFSSYQTETTFAYITMIGWLFIYEEIIALYAKLSTLYGQNSEFLMLRHVVQKVTTVL